MKKVFILLLFNTTFASTMNVVNAFQQSLKQISFRASPAAAIAGGTRARLLCSGARSQTSKCHYTFSNNSRQYQSYGSYNKHVPVYTRSFASNSDSGDQQLEQLHEESSVATTPDEDNDDDDDDDEVEDDDEAQTEAEAQTEKFDYTSTRFQQKIDEEGFFSEAERDANRIAYPKGTPDGFYIVKQYSVPPQGFENLVTNTDGTQGVGITQEEVDRLGINGGNITLPIALMLFDGGDYPSLSRARKSCR